MLLSELLATPRLGLRLLYAAPGALHEPVGRPITIDLLQPDRFLAGGEMVLTGLVWRRDPTDSVTFVRSCASRGVTVLAAGSALFDGIPDDVVEACRRESITVVSVPADVAFADVTEHLAATASGTGARVTASLVRQRRLLSMIAEGRGVDELTADVGAEIGRELGVMTPSGRVVAPLPSPPDDATVERLTRRFLTAEQLPAVETSTGRAWSLWPVGPVFDSRLTAWFLAADGNHASWPPEHTEAIRDLRDIAALDRGRRDEHRRTMLPPAAVAVQLIRDGGSPAEVGTRLRQAGLEPGDHFVVLMVRLTGKHAGKAVQLADDLALTLGPSVVSEAPDGGHVAVVRSSPGLGERLRRAVHLLAAGTAPGTLSVGLSDDVRLESLAGALDEATFAERVARDRPGPATLVGPEDVTSHVVLLAAVPDDVRRTFAHRVLGDVVGHDRRTGSDLIATLQQWLECSGSWTRTAEAMHLHVNTVRYRIEKVQDLTGRDLTDLGQRVDVFLALRSL